MHFLKVDYATKGPDAVGFYPVVDLCPQTCNSYNRTWTDYFGYNVDPNTGLPLTAGD